MRGTRRCEVRHRQRLLACPVVGDGTGDQNSADCDRILFTDSVDEAMERILSAATHEFGLVWKAAPANPPRWYLGEQGVPKGEGGPVAAK